MRVGCCIIVCCVTAADGRVFSIGIVGYAGFRGRISRSPISIVCVGGGVVVIGMVVAAGPVALLGVRQHLRAMPRRSSRREHADATARAAANGEGVARPCRFA